MDERELEDAMKQLADMLTKHSFSLVWPGFYALLRKAPFFAWPALEDAH